MTATSPASQAPALYTAAQVRELDRVAIEEAGIPGYTLMSRAGEAAWQLLCSHWPQLRCLGVVCGTGNNGGDGYVLARLALAAGVQVKVLQTGDVSRIGGDALRAREDALAAGVGIGRFDAASLSECDVLVDALLGTGLERPLEGEWRSSVEAVNAASVPVLAIDIPSGLHADTGAVQGVSVAAEYTVTFIARKQGLYTGEGPRYAGRISLEDLGVPAEVYQRVAPQAFLLLKAPLGPLARPRPRTAHKGHNGHVLVVGGDHGMAGAVRLAGEAALCTGAGLVTLATRPEHASALAAACPELMCHGATTARELEGLLQRATVVLAGPGLGQSKWSQTLFTALLDVRTPVVMDADALNLLAREPERRENWVLTPHPGEAGRLLNQSVTHIQADRFAAVRALCKRYGGTSVLKGAGTLIGTGEQPIDVCHAGNPGMATGGMGDVLSGVIAGLAAQGLVLPQAASAGVCVHALAGDRAAARGERGMLARDVIAELRTVMQVSGEIG